MYSIGSLADLISGSNTLNKPSIKLETVKTELNEKVKSVKHIEIKLQPQPEKEISKTLKRKQKKNKNHTKEKKFKSNKKEDEEDEIGEIERIVSKKIKLKKEVNKEDDKDKNERTVFVGNVPLNADKKAIKKLFSLYGSIESLRVRGVPVADPKIPAKVAFIKKQFHPNRKSLQYYIVFSNAEGAVRSLEANGTAFMSHHLRVDRVNSTDKADKEKAIFIGNLPFDAEEDDLWALFEECGQILSVRIIRDAKTHVGKGIAFINFDSADAVELALQMEDLKLGNREIRVKRCLAEKKKTKEGQKIRKVPRVTTTENRTQIKNKKEKKRVEFQGSKFSDKKKKKKLNKEELKKKKISKMLVIKPKSVGN